MKYRIRHVTHYHYPGPVSLCHNELHLAPRDTAVQSLQSLEIQVSPLPGYQAERLDFFGNRVHCFSIRQSHRELEITAGSQVILQPSGAEPRGLQAWETVCDRLLQENTSETLDARQYVLPSPQVPLLSELHDYAARSLLPGRPLREAVEELMGRIFQDFEYRPGFTSVSTELSMVMRHRCGVCQDFAHLALGCLRSHGLAARYVSGYLETLPPPGQKKLEGADASHAWFSVYIPGEGWLDLDPTNNLIPMDRHITLAWGRDYTDVTPVKGVLFGGGDSHALEVRVDVVREG
ncbi:transglutaminase family protein [Ectothiorhodospira lacustris]|uniref:transglutaminase family protein n=1 Tax=Ectothiorhodospira lacustris TaxID=2899127 RepID=UPI001EE91378|nr:transglutaminase family protein [Ectothiorhodospira lacustris]MCG5500022.1 transglutaminase family protein [Ectothiorhodospira lacustris]MCG5510066.1 transglutaminase family protein [Ectothiorhodospira lacustris]MCG5521812.1 transglutaminase family protein [Ectothiorhodospira lacustris]